MSTSANNPFESQIADAQTFLRTNPPQAMKIAYELLSNVEFVANVENELECLLIVCRSMINAGRYSEARAIAMEVNQVAIEQKLRVFEARSLNELGIISFVDKEYLVAIRQYDVAEALAKEVDARRVLMNIKVNKGNAYNRLGHLSQSALAYEEALRIADEVSDMSTQARVLMGLSSLKYGVYNNPTMSYTLSVKALDKYRMLNDTIGQTKALQNVGHYATLLGRYTEGIASFESSLSISSEFTEPSSIYGSYYGLVHTLLKVGQVGNAGTVLDKMRSDKRGCPSADKETYLSLASAEVGYAEGHADDVANDLLEHKELAKSRGAIDFHEQHWEILGMCLLAAKRYQEAALVYKEMYHKVSDEDRTLAESSVDRLEQYIRQIETKATSDIERIRDVELKGAVEKKDALLRENETFIRLLAHELKSPLQTVRAIAGLMQIEDRITREVVGEYASDLRDVANKMFDLVTQVLDSAKGVMHRVEKTINARTVWEYVIQQSRYIAKEKNITIEVDFSNSEYLVNASEQSLITVLDNLLSNAIKYSDPYSNVLVMVSTVLKLDALAVELTVSDSGPGISPSDKHLLFRPFTTLSARPTHGEASTGLGLHLVKRELDSMAGSIEYNDSVQNGAEFKVHIPLWENPESYQLIIARHGVNE